MTVPLALLPAPPAARGETHGIPQPGPRRRADHLRGCVMRRLATGLLRRFARHLPTGSLDTRWTRPDTSGAEDDYWDGVS